MCTLLPPKRKEGKMQREMEQGRKWLGRNGKAGRIEMLKSAAGEEGNGKTRNGLM